MKIIYVLGDGRSGSTLLDSVLSNTEDSISVGECYRFWKRYYSFDTKCGCGNKIEECFLWRQIHLSLSKIEGYNPNQFWNQVQFLLKYKNVLKINELLKKQEFKLFKIVVENFYQSIFEITNKSVIIDSSKNFGWLYILLEINNFDIEIIHIERNLQSVANSWKKKVMLPEYYDKEILMPIKSNFTILKSWYKVKYLSSKLKSRKEYSFIKYEEFIKNPNELISEINSKFNFNIQIDYLKIQENHSIGGNPMRNNKNKKLIIKNVNEQIMNLNLFEIIVFKFFNKMSKFLV